MLLVAALRVGLCADDVLAWVDTALLTHECMIGGGRELFLQRWGECVDGEPHGEYKVPICAWLSTPST